VWQNSGQFFGAAYDRALYSAEVYVPVMEGLREEILTDALTRLQNRLRASDIGALGATAEATIGMPSRSIVEYAAAHNIDLIVMSTHGRGGMSHLLMGSVAERVGENGRMSRVDYPSRPRGWCSEGGLRGGCRTTARARRNFVG